MSIVNLTEPPTPEIYSPFWYRVLEIVPGACAWTAIIAPFILSIYLPLAVSVFIIIFDTYWLMTSLTYGGALIRGYSRLRKSLRTNWNQKLKALEGVLPEELANKHWLDWRQLYQAVILTTYKEDISTLDASIGSIAEADYPNDHLIMVLATEERDAANARAIGEKLKVKYAHKFFLFLVTEHPGDILGEMKGKATNATWAAKQLILKLTEDNIELKNVVVSTADADTRFPKNFFSCLSYKFATTPDRIQCGFQPVSTFFNNIWDTPAIARVMAFGTTFWQMIQSVREYRLVTFSTHAMSLQTLLDMDFWCRTIVNEDSRQFYRAFFHYNGNFRSVPLFMPTYMDAVSLGSYKETYHNLYLQQQRWAYGVEHFPYVVISSARHPEIPLLRRLALIWRIWQGSFSWATYSFFITVVGWLPLVLNSHFREQVIASNFPLVTKSLLALTWIGLVVSSTITLFILPNRPKGKSKLHLSSMVLQWLLVPITAIFFGAMPGLDAQTRLMLGKYLGFRVTPKKVL